MIEHNHFALRICGDNPICPVEHFIAWEGLKGQHEPVNSAAGKKVIGVFQFVGFEKSAELRSCTRV